MKSKLIFAIALVLVNLMVGCAGTAKGAVLQSDKPRLAPDASDAETTELAAGNSAFALDLYQVLREDKDNLVYSPYSISLALAMTYAGARGETEHQMAETLCYNLPQNRLHPAFNALDVELASRGEGARSKDGEGFRLSIANAIWGQENYEFLPRFLDVLAENYGAGLRLVDFASAPEESCETINGWVSDQTEGKIKDLIPKSAIDAWTRLVLVNAIYFDAAWLHPFEARATGDGAFHLLDSTEVTVPMMAQTESFPYTEGEGYQAVELQYDRRELSMVILLPRAGQFEVFEDSLDAERVSSILKEVHAEEVRLTMPKFAYDSSFELAETLSDMGMPDAFLYQVADFSGMDGSRELFIGQVVHKAFVVVDEEGTEAGAASAVVVPGAAPQPHTPIEVTIDRPFVFLIRDISTDAILFIGRVLNPGA